MNQSFTGYRCSLCNAQYLPDQVQYTCPKDGGNLDVILDYQAINRLTSPQEIMALEEQSLWRYLALLPVGDPHGGGRLSGPQGARLCSVQKGCGLTWACAPCG